MAKITRFEDLKCWQEARILVSNIFNACQKGELSKDFETKNQLKSCAISAMNNIAEGFCRFNRKEFLRFLDFSQSSASEVKSMLYVLEDIKYLSLDDLRFLHEQVDKTRNMTLGLAKYITQKQTRT